MRWRRRHVITKDVMDRTPHRGHPDDGEPWPGMGHVTRPPLEGSSTSETGLTGPPIAGNAGSDTNDSLDKVSDHD